MERERQRKRQREKDIERGGERELIEHCQNKHRSYKRIDLHNCEEI